jgi:hypothetical protein
MGATRTGGWYQTPCGKALSYPILVVPKDQSQKPRQEYADRYTLAMFNKAK